MNRSKKYIYIYFICSILIITFICRFHFNYLKQQSFIFISPGNFTCVTNNPFKCIKTKLLLNKYRTTVCVYNQEKDTDVSGLLLKSGIWEEDLVTRLVRILSANNRLAFFDIGANIGIYTMYAAASGCSNIITIECFRPNIDRICQAVQIEHVEKQVTIIPYALYNQSNVYLSLRTNIMNNIGSQRLDRKVNKNELDPFIVKTIRFDDLLSVVNQRSIREAIIKIDIETSEHFLCETGERMFDQINIPFVMMEWALVKTIPARANFILQFFISRSYIPFDSNTCQPQTNLANYKQWNSQDIYWIKMNYTHFCNL
jgi:FkbM family methyltransferase